MDFLHSSSGGVSKGCFDAKGFGTLRVSVKVLFNLKSLDGLSRKNPRKKEKTKQKGTENKKPSCLRIRCDNEIKKGEKKQPGFFSVSENPSSLKDS